MDYEKNIHDFLDGSLDSEQEERLFGELSSGEESRAEFKRQLAIKSAVKSDKSVFVPSARSTSKVFSALGLSAGAAYSKGGATPKKAGFFGSKYFPAVAAAVSAALVALVGALIFLPKFDALRSEKASLKNDLNAISQKMDKANESIASFEKALEKRSKPSEPIVKYVYLKQKKVQQNETVAKETPIAKLNEKRISELTYASAAENYPGDLYISDFKRSRRSSIEYPKTSDFSELTNVRRDFGFNVELRKLETWHNTYPSVNPSNYNKFNNTSLTALYEITDGLKVGGEIRQETFFQSFEGNDALGVSYRYEQQPNFTSGALVVRYADEDFNLWGVYPMAQASFGGTNVGYIGRLMGGAVYSPYPNVDFLVGFEASDLMYKHDGSAFNSLKYDLNYGVSVRF